MYKQLLMAGIGLAFLGTQAGIAAPIRRPAPPDVIINSDPQPSVPTASGNPQSLDPRFSCQYFNGQPTVMYRPESQPGRAYPWAVPRTLGDGWTAERRCQEISQRLERYRPDGLDELRTGFENGYQTICVTTASVPQCRIVLTVPPGQNAEVVRDRVFESISIADSGQMTQGVNAFTGNNNNFVNQLGRLFNVPLPKTSAMTPRRNGINLRPFLATEDGGTGERLTRTSPRSGSSNRFNPGQFR
ncbi:MAG: COP23 domain-containing protein [Snowella sp.]|nr:COP23 domain-containing protein [Snowella sp.]